MSKHKERRDAVIRSARLEIHDVVQDLKIVAEKLDEPAKQKLRVAIAELLCGAVLLGDPELYESERVS
jgi:hypothetical protein